MPSIAEIFTPSSTNTSMPEYTNATSGADIMGKEDFLTLLVAQLQNQDPMNPDDPTEFTAQLAQFSSLEQLFNLNESMDELAVSQVQSDNLGTMNLMGKEVVYADSSFNFSGEPVNVGYQLDGSAASVTMYIQDEDGASIATLHPTDFSEGDHFLEWNGLDSDGNVVPDGNYDIILQASSSGENSTIAISPLVQSTVTGVEFNTQSGEPVLHTLAGAEIATSSVIAAYQPDQVHDNNVLEDDEESDEDNETEKSIFGVTRMSTPAQTKESVPMDEDQIEQEILQHLLAG